MSPEPTDSGEVSNVYVVDDDPGVRDSLLLLLRVRGFAAQGFGSAEELLAQGTLARPACALVDVRLPGMDGLQLQRELHTAQPGLPVVVITGHGDVGTARIALRDGAVDFLEKPIDIDELFEAVALALASEQRAVQKQRDHAAAVARLARLTARERDVFDRITDGRHNREIGEEFGISPRTVEVHRARIMDKLQARRMADLFRLRFELETAEPPRA